MGICQIFTCCLKFLRYDCVPDMMCSCLKDDDDLPDLEDEDGDDAGEMDEVD